MKRDLAFACALATIVTLSVDARGAQGDLEAGFASPPASVRPWVYWFIMDGHLNRDGITADFEALQKAGIGGMIVMEVNVGIPRGPVEFMSPQWRQLFKHADAEAQRLGLQITLNAGPGWTGSGGPWIKPEQSMQHLVASAVDVTGLAKFSAKLSRPAPRPPYFGSSHLPADLLKAINGFYVDVAVLAVPQTGDAARITDIDEKALYLRHPYSSRPNTKPCLPSQAQYASLGADAVIAPSRVVDLTGRMAADGSLTWDVPEGKWTILRFGRTSTGANTRPAPAPGLGLECDKMDKAALEAHFEAFVAALLREVGPRKAGAQTGWNMLHIDSWEMGAQNWTAAFREEFRRRRGYDPMRYLPALTGRVVESLEVSERFLWDLRQTAQELVLENHARHLRDLGHRNGLGLSIEPYDMNPCSDMDLGAAADVPMCEFWLYGFKTWFSVIEASSIAHTGGRPIVAAESFTSSDAERWQAYPASMKSLGDWAFCSGVNRIVFHRCQHQPWAEGGRPGMTMGPYGVHWERTQTWWDMVPAYHQYLARCQHMLRQGLPVADICYLVAEGAPHVFLPPSSATRGAPPERKEYNFDGCSAEMLMDRVSVRDGQLALPDGMSYRVLVLPQRDTMTPKLLRKVKELVEAGATVIGPRPVKSPSLSDYPQCDAEVRQLANELWGSDSNSGGGRLAGPRFIGKGRLIATEIPAGPQPSPPPADHPLKRAKWIWHKEGTPGVMAPVGLRYFRREVTIDANAVIESAHVLMTADNVFELWVNGTRAGSGDNFHETYDMDVAALLKPGVNLLAVRGENGGDAPNPAGLIGTLVIRLRSGRVIETPTDRQWQTAVTAEGQWMSPSTPTAGWGAAKELGPSNMAPWKLDCTSPAAPAEQYGDFAVVADVLGKMGVTPDFESSPSLRYTHRRDGETDIYFVANREDRLVEADCTFRVAGKSPELWDPLTGQTRALPEFKTANGRTTLPMRFEPTGAYFVIFRKAASEAAPTGKNFPDFTKAAELGGPWDVSFDPKWGGPEKIAFATLQDWTTRPEEGIRFYSGVATYRKSFDLPTSVPASGSAIFLDLGVVKNLAQVRLNGQDLGAVWCAPWRVEITKGVKARDNQLEIKVANLWPNRLIGDQSLPADKRIEWSTWNPFKKDSPLLSSGLLGPVTIQVTAMTAPIGAPQ